MISHSPFAVYDSVDLCEHTVIGGLLQRHVQPVTSEKAVFVIRYFFLQNNNDNVLPFIIKIKEAVV